MRDKVADEAWIRAALQGAGMSDVVYVTPNHYDGGYEVKLGSAEAFVEYGVIDADETEWLSKLITKYAKG